MDWDTDVEKIELHHRHTRLIIQGRIVVRIVVLTLMTLLVGAAVFAAVQPRRIDSGSRDHSVGNSSALHRALGLSAGKSDTPERIIYG